MTWFVTKICHFFVFVYWRGTKKHSYWSKISLGPKKCFLGPMKMFSWPPSINKNKEVTSFCDKSCHLFLWQTNRTRLLTAQYLYCEFTLWTYLWTQLAFFKKISVKEASVAKHGHEKWMDCGDEISNIPAIDQHIAACISYVFL